MQISRPPGMILAVSPLPGVSRTAIGVARVRAAETVRAEPLFTDPYADAFVHAAGADGATPDAATLTEEQRRWRAGIVFPITMRTRFFDDYLRQALADGCRQVVVLGAGLDSRAFRLDWPAGLRWFEIDLPQVLAFKQTVLDAEGASPRCDPREVPPDLAGDWAADLQAAGFVPTLPTAWLAEGLLVYLSGETAAHVLVIATDMSAA